MQMDDEFYAGVNDAKLNKMPPERNGRIIVRNISFKATKESLQEHFSKYGNILEVNLLKKPDGKLVGCGFVHFADVADAEKAIAATNKKPFMGNFAIYFMQSIRIIFKLSTMFSIN